jgi:hypothetical protein
MAHFLPEEEEIILYDYTHKLIDVQRDDINSSHHQIAFMKMLNIYDKDFLYFHLSSHS